MSDLSSALISDQLSSKNHSYIHTGQAIPAGNSGLSDTIGSQPMINQALGRGIDCFAANIDSVTNGLFDPNALSDNIFDRAFNSDPIGLGKIAHDGFDFKGLGDCQVEKMNEGNLVINSDGAAFGAQGAFSPSNSR